MALPWGATAAASSGGASDDPLLALPPGLTPFACLVSRIGSGVVLAECLVAATGGGAPASPPARLAARFCVAEVARAGRVALAAASPSEWLAAAADTARAFLEQARVQDASDVYASLLFEAPSSGDNTTSEGGVSATQAGLCDALLASPPPIVEAHARGCLGVGWCAALAATQADCTLATSASSRRLLASLRAIQDALRTVMSIKDTGAREGLYHLVHDAASCTAAVADVLTGYDPRQALQVLTFLFYSIVCVEAVPQLATSRFLPLRMHLYGAVCAAADRAGVVALDPALGAPPPAAPGGKAPSAGATKGAAAGGAAGADGVAPLGRLPPGVEADALSRAGAVGRHVGAASEALDRGRKTVAALKRLYLSDPPVPEVTLAQCDAAKLELSLRRLRYDSFLMPLVAGKAGAPATAVLPNASALGADGAYVTHLETLLASTSYFPSGPRGDPARVQGLLLALGWGHSHRRRVLLHAPPGDAQEAALVLRDAAAVTLPAGCAPPGAEGMTPAAAGDAEGRRVRAVLACLLARLAPFATAALPLVHAHVRRVAAAAAGGVAGGDASAGAGSSGTEAPLSWEAASAAFRDATLPVGAPESTSSPDAPPLTLPISALLPLDSHLSLLRALYSYEAWEAWGFYLHAAEARVAAILDASASAAPEEQALALAADRELTLCRRMRELEVGSIPAPAAVPAACGGAAAPAASAVDTKAGKTPSAGAKDAKGKGGAAAAPAAAPAPAPALPVSSLSPLVLATEGKRAAAAAKATDLLQLPVLHAPVLLLTSALDALDAVVRCPPPVSMPGAPSLIPASDALVRDAVLILAEHAKALAGWLDAQPAAATAPLLAKETPPSLGSSRRAGAAATRTATPRELLPLLSRLFFSLHSALEAVDPPAGLAGRPGAPAVHSLAAAGTPSPWAGAAGALPGTLGVERLPSAPLLDPVARAEIAVRAVNLFMLAGGAELSRAVQVARAGLRALQASRDALVAVAGAGDAAVQGALTSVDTQEGDWGVHDEVLRCCYLAATVTERPPPAADAAPATTLPLLTGGGPDGGDSAVVAQGAAVARLHATLACLHVDLLSLWLAAELRLSAWRAQEAAVLAARAKRAAAAAADKAAVRRRARRKVEAAEELAGTATVGELGDTAAAIAALPPLGEGKAGSEDEEDEDAEAALQPARLPYHTPALPQAEPAYESLLLEAIADAGPGFGGFAPSEVTLEELRSECGDNEAWLALLALARLPYCYSEEQRRKTLLVAASHLAAAVKQDAATVEATFGAVAAAAPHAFRPGGTTPAARAGARAFDAPLVLSRSSTSVTLAPCSHPNSAVGYFVLYGRQVGDGGAISPRNGTGLPGTGAPLHVGPGSTAPGVTGAPGLFAADSASARWPERRTAAGAAAAALAVVVPGAAGSLTSGRTLASCLRGTITALRPNATYTFAAGGHASDNGALIGALSTPTGAVLAASPLPLSYLWALLASEAARHGGIGVARIALGAALRPYVCERAAENAFPGGRGEAVPASPYSWRDATVARAPLPLLAALANAVAQVVSVDDNGPSIASPATAATVATAAAGSTGETPRVHPDAAAPGGVRIDWPDTDAVIIPASTLLDPDGHAHDVAAIGRHTEGGDATVYTAARSGKALTAPVAREAACLRRCAAAALAVELAQALGDPALLQTSACALVAALNPLLLPTWPRIHPACLTHLYLAHAALVRLPRVALTPAATAALARVTYALGLAYLQANTGVEAATWLAATAGAGAEGGIAARLRATLPPQGAVTPAAAPVALALPNVCGVGSVTTPGGFKPSRDAAPWALEVDTAATLGGDATNPGALSATAQADAVQPTSAAADAVLHASTLLGRAEAGALARVLLWNEPWLAKVAPLVTSGAAAASAAAAAPVAPASAGAKGAKPAAAPAGGAPGGKLVVASRLLNELGGVAPKVTEAEAEVWAACADEAGKALTTPLAGLLVLLQKHCLVGASPAAAADPKAKGGAAPAAAKGAKGAAAAPAAPAPATPPPRVSPVFLDLLARVTGVAAGGVRALAPLARADADALTTQLMAALNAAAAAADVLITDATAAAVPDADPAATALRTAVATIAGSTLGGASAPAAGAAAATMAPAALTEALRTVGSRVARAAAGLALLRPLAYLAAAAAASDSAADAAAAGSPIPASSADAAIAAAVATVARLTALDYDDDGADELDVLFPEEAEASAAAGDAATAALGEAPPPPLAWAAAQDAATFMPARHRLLPLAAVELLRAQSFFGRLQTVAAATRRLEAAGGSEEAPGGYRWRKPASEVAAAVTTTAPPLVDAASSSFGGVSPASLGDHVLALLEPWDGGDAAAGRRTVGPQYGYQATPAPLPALTDVNTYCNTLPLAAHTIAAASDAAVVARCAGAWGAVLRAAAVAWSAVTCGGVSPDWYGCLAVTHIEEAALPGADGRPVSATGLLDDGVVPIRVMAPGASSMTGASSPTVGTTALAATTATTAASTDGSSTAAVESWQIYPPWTSKAVPTEEALLDWRPLWRLALAAIDLLAAAASGALPVRFGAPGGGAAASLPASSAAGSEAGPAARGRGRAATDGGDSRPVTAGSIASTGSGLLPAGFTASLGSLAETSPERPRSGSPPRSRLPPLPAVLTTPDDGQVPEDEEAAAVAEEQDAAAAALAAACVGTAPVALSGSDVVMLSRLLNYASQAMLHAQAWKALAAFAARLRPAFAHAAALVAAAGGSLVAGAPAPNPWLSLSPPPAAPDNGWGSVGAGWVGVEGAEALLAAATLTTPDATATKAAVLQAATAAAASATATALKPLTGVPGAALVDDAFRAAMRACAYAARVRWTAALADANAARAQLTAAQASFSTRASLSKKVKREKAAEMAHAALLASEEEAFLPYRNGLIARVQRLAAREAVRRGVLAGALGWLRRRARDMCPSKRAVVLASMPALGYMAFGPGSLRSWGPSSARARGSSTGALVTAAAVPRNPIHLLGPATQALFPVEPWVGTPVKRGGALAATVAASSTALTLTDGGASTLAPRSHVGAVRSLRAAAAAAAAAAASAGSTSPTELSSSGGASAEGPADLVVSLPPSSYETAVKGLRGAAARLRKRRDPVHLNAVLRTLAHVHRLQAGVSLSVGGVTSEAVALATLECAALEEALDACFPGAIGARRDWRVLLAEANAGRDKAASSVLPGRNMLAALGPVGCLLVAVTAVRLVAASEALEAAAAAVGARNTTRLSGHLTEDERLDLYLLAAACVAATFSGSSLASPLKLADFSRHRPMDWPAGCGDAFADERLLCASETAAALRKTASYLLDHGSTFAERALPCLAAYEHVAVARLGHPSTVTDARLLRGQAQVAIGDLEGAVDTLVSVYTSSGLALPPEAAAFPVPTAVVLASLVAAKAAAAAPAPAPAPAGKGGKDAKPASGKADPKAAAAGGAPPEADETALAGSAASFPVPAAYPRYFNHLPPWHPLNRAALSWLARDPASTEAPPVMLPPALTTLVGTAVSARATALRADVCRAAAAAGTHGYAHAGLWDAVGMQALTTAGTDAAPSCPQWLNGAVATISPAAAIRKDVVAAAADGKEAVASPSTATSTAVPLTLAGIAAAAAAAPTPVALALPQLHWPLTAAPPAGKELETLARDTTWRPALLRAANALLAHALAACDGVTKLVDAAAVGLAPPGAAGAGSGGAAPAAPAKPGSGKAAPASAGKGGAAAAAAAASAVVEVPPPGAALDAPLSHSDVLRRREVASVALSLLRTAAGVHILQHDFRTAAATLAAAERLCLAAAVGLPATAVEAPVPPAEAEAHLAKLAALLAEGAAVSLTASVPDVQGLPVSPAAWLSLRVGISRCMLALGNAGEAGRGIGFGLLDADRIGSAFWMRRMMHLRGLALLADGQIEPAGACLGYVIESGLAPGAVDAGPGADPKPAAPSLSLDASAPAAAQPALTALDEVLDPFTIAHALLTFTRITDHVQGLASSSQAAAEAVPPLTPAAMRRLGLPSDLARLLAEDDAEVATAAAAQLSALKAALAPFPAPDTSMRLQAVEALLLAEALVRRRAAALGLDVRAHDLNADRLLRPVVFGVPAADASAAEKASGYPLPPLRPHVDALSQDGAATGTSLLVAIRTQLGTAILAAAAAATQIIPLTGDEDEDAKAPPQPGPTKRRAARRLAYVLAARKFATAVTTWHAAGLAAPAALVPALTGLGSALRCIAAVDATSGGSTGPALRVAGASEVLLLCAVEAARVDGTANPAALREAVAALACTYRLAVRLQSSGCHSGQLRSAALPALMAAVRLGGRAATLAQRVAAGHRFTQVQAALRKAGTGGGAAPAAAGGKGAAAGAPGAAPAIGGTTLPLPTGLWKDAVAAVAATADASRQFVLAATKLAPDAAAAPPPSSTDAVGEAGFGVPLLGTPLPPLTDALTKQMAAQWAGAPSLTLALAATLDALCVSQPSTLDGSAGALGWGTGCADAPPALPASAAAALASYLGAKLPEVAKAWTLPLPLVQELCGVTAPDGAAAPAPAPVPAASAGKKPASAAPPAAAPAAAPAGPAPLPQWMLRVQAAPSAPSITNPGGEATAALALGVLPADTATSSDARLSKLAGVTAMLRLPCDDASDGWTVSYLVGPPSGGAKSGSGGAGKAAAPGSAKGKPAAAAPAPAEAASSDGPPVFLFATTGAITSTLGGTKAVAAGDRVPHPVFAARFAHVRAGAARYWFAQTQDARLKAARALVAGGAGGGGAAPAAAAASAGKKGAAPPAAAAAAPTGTTTGDAAGALADAKSLSAALEATASGLTALCFTLSWGAPHCPSNSYESLATAGGTKAVGHWAADTVSSASELVGLRGAGDLDAGAVAAAATGAGPEAGPSADAGAETDDPDDGEAAASRLPATASLQRLAEAVRRLAGGVLDDGGASVVNRRLGGWLRSRFPAALLAMPGADTARPASAGK